MRDHDAPEESIGPPRCENASYRRNNDESTRGHRGRRVPAADAAREPAAHCKTGTTRGTAGAARRGGATGGRGAGGASAAGLGREADCNPLGGASPEQHARAEGSWSVAGAAARRGGGESARRKEAAGQGG